MLGLFWPAFTGRAMFAPLDIPANLFSKFRSIDPEATGIPKNHYVIDLVLGDLSRNWLVYHAWQDGEIPWWDPYTHRGRPLAAEANAVNASDPVKFILYRLLPFEHAYNWTRIVMFLVSGLTMFLLLREFGFPVSFSVWGGLLYEFAGCNFILFSGPMLQATFAYYPLLWLLWHRGVAGERFVWFPLSVPVVALIFLCGNLQSHAYLAVFALVFLLGYGGRHIETWRAILPGLVTALALGLLVAGPFVWPQIELYFLSGRELPPGLPAKTYLSGLASLSAIFPWSLGTFRTLDASKWLDQAALGFLIYVGSAALVIAAIGVRRRPEQFTGSAISRTALLLVIAYFVICSTPLLRVLYTRTAWLAVLGLVVLIANGLLVLKTTTRPWKSLGTAILVGCALITILFNLVAVWVYPKLQPRIETRFLKATEGHRALDLAEPLRRFQVRNFLNELTFKNPETVLAIGSLVALALYLRRPDRMDRSLALHAILVLNIVPLLWFGHRYVPLHQISLWEKFRTGGPEHRRVFAAVKPTDRLMELAPGMHDQLFPGAISQLFRVRVTHGYSSFSFVRPNQAAVSSELLFDYKYSAPQRGSTEGELVKAEHQGSSRFRWADASTRSITIRKESLNTLILAVEPGAATELIRTDTHYPGWRAYAGRSELPILAEPPQFSRIAVPEGVTEITLRYEPRFWRHTLGLASAGAVATLALAAGAFIRRRKS